MRRPTEQLLLFLEQTRDPSILIDIDLLCRWHLRKSWHRHDVAGQRYDESCARGYFQVADSYYKVLRCAEQLRIVRKAVLRLRHTDRIVTKSKLSQAFCLLLCCIREYNAIAVVDLLHDHPASPRSLYRSRSSSGNRSQSRTGG